MNSIIKNEFSHYFDNFTFSKPLNLILKKETASTNTDAKKLGEESNEDALIIALRQTDGKGRLNRSFFSPSGTGLYLSLLLHPLLEAESVTFLTSLTAVAVAKAIERISNQKAYIKWVNDIYINNKKVCGILCNSAFSKDGKLSYAVIGIGININTPKNDFPDDIKDIASSVFKDTPITTAQRTELVNCIVNEILYAIDNDVKAHLNEYRERSFLKDKTVTFTKDGKVTTAKVIGIDDDCSLLLKTLDGKTVSLFAGEVSVKQSV